ncbi:hypothetical protein BSNK01_17820 [Bacillaceae bacterium]
MRHTKRYSKGKFIVLVVMVLALACSGSVLAFGAGKGPSADGKRDAGTVTYEQAAKQIVKRLKLDGGLPVPKDADPQAPITREQFAHLLMQAVEKAADLAWIEIYVQIADEKEIDPDYMTSIQRLLIAHIAELDEKGNFYPKRALTRKEAAEWLQKTVRLLAAQQNEKPGEDRPGREPGDEPVWHKPVTGKPGGGPGDGVDRRVEMTVEKINGEVNKVTVSWGEKPNAGYRVTITKIQFGETGEARIYYRLETPRPGQMYPQVITRPKAETYVSSQYKPVLVEDKKQPFAGKKQSFSSVVGTAQTDGAASGSSSNGAVSSPGEASPAFPGTSRP